MSDIQEIIERADGHYEREEYKQAFELFGKAAKSGDAYAQYSLAYMYETGEGVKENKKAASEWYLQAAEQGRTDAQFSLGLLHNEDDEYDKAFYWFKKAAEQGHAKAQSWLGEYYDNGKGTEQDEKKAFYWHKKAAEQDYALAQYNLGCCYYSGEGVEKNHDQAMYWFKKAAEQGNEDAQEWLENYESGDDEEITEGFSVKCAWCGEMCVVESLLERDDLLECAYCGKDIRYLQGSESCRVEEDEDLDDEDDDEEVEYDEDDEGDEIEDYEGELEQYKKTSHEEVRKSAKKGVPEAMYELGVRIINGAIECDPDDDNWQIGGQWVQKAVEAGYDDPGAKNLLLGLESADGLDELFAEAREAVERYEEEDREAKRAKQEAATRVERVIPILHQYCVN